MNLKLKIQHLFLRLEIGFLKKKTAFREKLQKNHLLYAFIGGTGMVLFWHGIWEGLNVIYLHTQGWVRYIGHPITSFVIGTIILAATGLFVFELIGRDARAFEQKYGYKLEKLKKLNALLDEEENEEKKEEELKEIVNEGVQLEKEE